MEQVTIKICTFNAPAWPAKFNPGQAFAQSVMVHLMGIMKIFSNSILILLMIFLSSCSALVSTIYGIKSIKHRPIEDIKKYAQKYNIPLINLCLLDTSYISFINNVDSSNSLLAKNHYQPLQVLYFDNSGDLVSFYNNCHAGGFQNLKWNRSGSLKSFVPKSQIKTDSLLNFKKQLQFLIDPHGEKLILSNYNSANYNIVVYWNIFMGRQSRRLIKQIKGNCKLAENETVNLIFVNNDEFSLLFGN